MTHTKAYWHVRWASTTRPEDFPIPLKDGIASHPLEGNLRGTEALSQQQSWLEAFRGKDCFRIGTGNFADRDPAESAD